MTGCRTAGPVAQSATGKMRSFYSPGLRDTFMCHAWNAFSRHPTRSCTRHAHRHLPVAGTGSPSQQPSAHLVPIPRA